MSEQQGEYKTETDEGREAMEMLGKGYGNEPAAIIESPSRKMYLRDSMDEQYSPAWVKLSTAFKPHIKELRGSPLAVWLFISLSIDKSGKAFPAIATIAKETGYSRQGVMDAITILERKGYLAVRRGERRFNFYEPEFAAIGKGKEPTEMVNSVDHLKKESSISAKESSLPPQMVNPTLLKQEELDKQEYGDKSPIDPASLPLDWKIASGAKITAGDFKTEEQSFEIRAKDAAWFIDNGPGVIFDMALAFMLAREMLPRHDGTGYDDKDCAKWRKAFREMRKANPHPVEPKHITAAVQKLLEIRYTVSSPMSVIGTATDLANPAPGQASQAGLPVLDEIPTDASGVPMSY